MGKAKSEVYYLMTRDEIEDEVSPFCSDSCCETYAENSGYKKYDINVCDDDYADELAGEKCEWCGSSVGT